MPEYLAELMEAVLVSSSEPGGRDAFILGAGFSRAISDVMPLTDELGNMCLEDARLCGDSRVPSEGFRDGNFEVWLSHLADEQPYLRTEENLENQALFQRFSFAISERLGSCVTKVLSEPAPDWLVAFLRLCDQRRNTLISFNYDTLIECAVGVGLRDVPKAVQVYWKEVIGNVPNWPPGEMRYGATPVETFDLLKLHGSLNWYWTPGDASGISMALRDLPGSFESPEPYVERDRWRHLPGRVPFVVPPSASKSPFYRNPVVREVWRQAFESLRLASRVVLMGYSLPLTDLTFARMFSTALTNTSADIVVVDRSPKAVAERVVRLGINENRVRQFRPRKGNSAIPDFVTALLSKRPAP